MQSVRRSLAFSVGGSYFGLATQVVGMVVLSRLLSPADLGVFAIAGAVSSLARAIREFGIGDFVVQRPQLTDRDLRGALALSLIVSWSLGALIAALSPLVARYYREPGIADVMQVQALSFVLVPFGAVTMAWFQRQLMPLPQFVAGVLADTTSLAVAVVCALHGLGVMSLAWSSLAGVAVSVATSQWYRPASLPVWPSLAGMREVFDFGKTTGGVNLLIQLGRSAPEFIVGKVLNVESVALFGRAYALVEVFQRLVVRSVQPVSLPVFARCTREQGSPLTAYLASVAHLTVVGWPVLGFLALMAPAAIRLVYGPQWAASADLSRVLCAAAAVELVHRFGREGVLAQGRSDRANATSLALQAMRVLGLTAVIPFGLPGACWGLLGAAVAGAALQHSTLERTIGLRMGAMARACLPSLGVSLCCCAPLAVWLAIDPPPESDFLLTVVLGALLTSTSWLASLHAMRHPLAAEVKGLLIRRRQAGP